MIKNIARDLFANLGIEIRRNDSIKWNKLKEFGIPREEWEYRDKGYYLKCLDIVVNDTSSPLLVDYKHAKRIVQNGKGQFFFDDQKCLRVRLSDVVFFVNHPDELFVLNEVFVQGDYNFKTTDNIIVIDIGLNIGATSLFFAKQENVRKVYSYELFPQTYKVGLSNLQVNDSSKIVSFNFGLGKNNREMTIPYSPHSKARMGINGLPGIETYPDVINEIVTIKDVAEEISKIHQLEPEIKKVCKMDCEGAEFEILERLFQTDSIELIDVYIIEWHDQNTHDIEQEFLAHGFDIIKTVLECTGLIYAFKGKSQ